MHTHSIFGSIRGSSPAQQWRRRLAAATVAASIASLLAPGVAVASSWSPTLLVNTESFNIIDDGDGTTNIELRFGDTANEVIRWDVTNSRFQFTDDVHIEGNITGSGTLTVDGNVKTKADLTINADNGAADAVLNFGSDGTAETVTFANTADRFEFSDDVRVTGNASVSGNVTLSGALVVGTTIKLNGVSYTFPTSDGSASGKVLKTNAAGQLSWSSDIDTGVSQTEADARYVNTSGDTMTGSLTIANAGTLAASGSIRTEGDFTLNQDNGDANAVLTFGNDAGAQNITYSNANVRFDFSDDIHTTGNYTGSGTLTVDSNVKTKADLTINSDNGSADAVLTFGSDGTAETLTFANTADRFEFSDDVRVTGNLSTSGNVTLSGALVVGSTIKLNGVTYTFPYSDGSASGKVLKTDGAGNLVWSTDSTGGGGLSQTEADARYVNLSGDTMTGSLTVANGGTIAASGSIRTEGDFTLNQDNGDANAVLTFGNDAGAQNITYSNANVRFDFSDDIHTTGNYTGSGTLTVDSNVKTKADLTINSDNGSADAVLTFGSDGTAETVTFANTADRFEFSDDVRVTGNASVSGNVTLSGALVVGSTIKLNGVTYTFPASDGTSSGKILTTNGAGQLAWTSLNNGSGNTVFLQPEYPHAVYFASGSAFIGQLSASGGTAQENNYTWTSSKPTIQDYWVSTKIKIPHDFLSWAPTPIQFRYKTGTAVLAQNHVTVKLLDTTGTQVALSTGALAGTTWRTTNITGPEATGTYTPDSYITVLVKVAATNTAQAQANAGFINLNWRTSAPTP